MPTLEWIGKRAVVGHHRVVPYHLLKCDGELSVGDPGSGNLLVQGDNLLALKALLPYYKGKVKCIFIDPPYNTGNEGWIYNDNVNSPEIQAWLQKTVGKEAEDLSRHDKWLCMMYPRIALLREFLTPDGVIFVTLDDNEVHNFRSLMNEIFGVQNFIATAIWQKRTSPDMRLDFSTAHDYVVVYARRAEHVSFHRVPKSAKQRAQFKNPDNDPRGPWVSSDYTAQGYRPNQMYEITTPGGTVYKPPKGVCWKNVESVFLELVADRRIWFGKNGKGMPRRKTFLSESQGNPAWTWWPNDEVGHTQEAKKELDSILGGDQPFDTPKPTRLLERVIELASDSNSIILDSFAGSGTTGHAVLRVNQKDGGCRRFILVEMDEAICKNITSERVKRVALGYKREDEKGEDIPGAGSGFRFCRLGPPLFAADGGFSKNVKFNDLAHHIWFRETGEPLPKGRNGRTPLLGVHGNAAFYLLYNGVLGDKSADGGNVLTNAVLAGLPKHSGPRIVFGEGCRLGKERLKREGVVFKQIPYDVRGTDL